MKPTHKKLCLFLAAVLCFSTLTGCGPRAKQETPEEVVQVDTKTAVLQCMSAISSVESHITLDMKAHVGAQGSTGAHSASIGSDYTLQMTADPLAVHGECYSRILVDGATSKDDAEYYIVEESDSENLVKYSYAADTDEWEYSILKKSDAMAVPAQTGLIYDWNAFLSYLKDENFTETVNGKTCYRLSGDVPANLLQELFAEYVFGTFMYSTEKLLTDKIPCVLYVDAASYFPEQVNFTFQNNFIVSDMNVDTALVTVDYSEWNAVPAIEIPKKVEIVATNPEAEFYSTYYIWNLFLPHLNGDKTGSDDPSGNEGLSFTSDWSTYQVRIDDIMTRLPIPWEDMEKIGYKLDGVVGSTIVEPNMYIEGIKVIKGSDSMTCTFYNPDAAPLPIEDCYIGAIDLEVANNANTGIQIYLPGEVCLGIDKEKLVSAYGTPDNLETAFSCDTYYWNGDNENQGFVAEVSPVNNQVIRIYLKNIPVTGGAQ